MLDRIQERLNIRNTNHRVSDRLLRNGALIICILILPTIVVNLIMDIPLYANMILIIGFIIYGNIYYQTRFTPSSRFTQYLFFGTGIGMSFPLWFLNGGIIGPMSPYLILLLLMGSFIAGRKQQSTIVFIYMVSVLTLIILELIWPELVWNRLDVTSNKYVMMAGLLFASLGASSLVTAFRISFLKDRKKLLKA